MEAGGKIKPDRGRQAAKPYTRSTGLLGRVSESVKDMFSPSWLVDLVSSVKKRTPPPETQPTQLQSRSHYNTYQQGYAAGRSMPDLSSTYMPPPGISSAQATVPSYNAHMQHSTPAQPHEQPLHFPTSDLSLTATLKRIDHVLTEPMQNGSEENAELRGFAAASSQYSAQMQQQNTVAPGKYFTNSENQSKIQQMRHDLGGSVTPSKEIEERANKLHTQMTSEKAQKPEPSFLWANERKKEIKASNPQPPAKRLKPNFNASVFGASTFGLNSTLESSTTGANSSFQSSSFYPGKTMFGGAAANRSKPRVNSPYQITPSRKQVTVRSVSSSQAGVTSTAAKRILDCLDRMSTPLSDAKKIPSYNSSLVDTPLSFSPGVYRRRSMRQGTAKNAPPPVAHLSTPGKTRVARNMQRVPHTDTLQRPSLHQQSADESTAQPAYGFNTQSKDSLKTGGKMKSEKKSKTRGQARPEDEEVEAIDLPTGFTLPVAGNSLPKFDFASTPAASAPRGAGKKPEFMTSSPILGMAAASAQSGATRGSKMTSPGEAVMPEFTFSSPIAQSGDALTVQAESSQKAFKFSSPISVDAASQAVKLSAASGIVSSAPTLAFSFQPDKAKPKPKAKPVEEPVVATAKPAAQLKTGGVMDFLSKTPTSAATNTSKPSAAASEPKPDTKLPPLSATFGKPTSGWRCPTCMVQNQDSMAKCPCCQEPKPVTKDLTKSTAITATATKTTTAPSLSEVFKAQSSSKWSCPTCMVSNDNTMAKCPCCETAKPGGGVKPSNATSAPVKSIDSSTKPLLSSMFKAAGWACPTCMVQNQDTMSKCPCCETPRPGGAASKNTPSKTQENAKPSLSEMFKKPAGSWDCDTCMVTNKGEAVKCIACETPRPGLKAQSSFTSPGGFSGFKFEVPASSISTTPSSSASASAGFGFGSKSDATSGTASSGFSFGTTLSKADTVNLKFGATPDMAKTDATTMENKIDEKKAATAGFQFGAPSGGSDKVAANTGFAFGVPKSDKKDTKKTESETKATPVFGFGSSTTTEKKDAPSGGFSLGVPKANESKADSKPKTNTNTDNKTVTEKPTGVTFGTSNTPSGTLVTESKPKSDAQPATNFSTSLFGNTSSSASNNTTTTSTSSSGSSGFTFGGASAVANSAPNTNPSATGGFSFGPGSSNNTAPKPASSIFGETAAKPTINTTANPVSTTSSSVAGSGTGIFSFNAGSAANTATSSAPAPVFGGFGNVAAKPAESTNTMPAAKPAENKPNLFAFGQPVTTNNAAENAAKPLGSTGGFSFSAAAAKPDVSKPASEAGSNLFAFKASTPGTDALGASPSLKRGRDTSTDSSQAKAQKPAANLFGNTGGNMFASKPDQPSSTTGFGSSAPVFGTGSGSSAMFGSTPQASSTTFGSGMGGSSIFGGSANNGAPQPSGGSTTGFNFAAAAAKSTENASAGSGNLFTFGGTQNQSSNNSAPVASNPFNPGVPTPQNGSAPVFGGAQAPAPAPTGGFNFSATPSFNFSAAGAAAPQFNASVGNNMFAAKPTGATGPAGRRPIKKAVRRTAKK